MLSHFSLFSGIGGVDLAAEHAGFKTVGQCEIDEYCQQVLDKYWPDVPKWGDVFELTGQEILDKCGRISLLSGGFPCQPFSVAGKRKGKKDKRHLWPEFHRIICEVRPDWVLAENVRGLLSIDAGRTFGRILTDLAESGYRVGWLCYGAGDVGAPHRRERVFIVAYSESCNDRRNARGFQEADELETEERQEKRITKSGGSGEILAYSAYAREQATERTAQCSLGGVLNGFSAGMDFLGWPAGPGAQHPWEPPRIATGVKNRVARLKALGNAVLPAQVYPILRAIAEIEKEA